MALIPTIYFSLLCIYFRVKHGRFEVSSFLASLYAISSFFSIISYNMNLHDIQYDMPVIHFLPTIIYCFLLTLTFLPFSLFHSEQIQTIETPKMWFFNTLSYLFMFMFLITLINVTPDIIEKAKDGELFTLRNTIYEDIQPEQPTGIHYVMALPATIFSACSPLIVMMYFYSVCFLNKSRIFNSMLLLSSLTPIISAILISGRTQITYWILVFVACYLFFRPHISAQLNKYIVWVFGILGLIVAGFFIAVTIARWKETELIKNALIVYAGEPYLEFCYFFDTFHLKQLHFQRLFPFTHYFILGRDIDLFKYREILYDTSGIYANVFNTFLGDMMLDIGKVGMFIYAFIYTALTTVFLHRSDKSVMPFYQLPIYIICLLVPLEGIFFYSFHTVRMSYYIIETFIICLIFRYSIKK